MPHRSVAAGLVVICGLVLASCGARPAGWGVVLWGEAAGAPRTGAVVGVLQESAIGEASLISVPGERKPREYPLGRIRMFKRKAEAASFAASYAAQADAWAVVVKEDSPPLPVREAPAPDAKVIYKLQYGQLVKVVGRSAQPATVKPYTDYWYELVTEDGFNGWCFGHFLKPFTAASNPAEAARKVLSQDDVLARIMGTTWRPGWFQDMMDRGAIDLAMFREDVGFFPDPQNRSMRLALPLSTIEFRYTGDPQKAGAASYTFPGTDLRVDVLGQDRITITYRYKDQRKTDLYLAVKDDVAQVVAAEQKRRADLFEALSRKGAVLASSAYGTIRLMPGMRFAWEGFSKLVPALIGPEAKGNGSVDFSLHVAKDLAAEYDGVITFVFDEYPRAGLSFLYKAASGGLRFTSLAPDSVQDLFVTHASLSAVIIFFRQSS